MWNIILPATIILIIGIFIFVSAFLLSPFISKIFQRRSNLMILGVVGLLLFIVGKYIWYIIAMVNNDPPIMISSIGESINAKFWDNIKIANLALVSFPDLLLLILSLTLIFDKTRTFEKAFSPYGLYFGLWYLICSTFIYTDQSYVGSFNLKWYLFVFEGDGITRMPSLTYCYLILISSISIISNREYSRWSITGSVLCGVLIIVYSIILQSFFNVGANGLTSLSFSGLNQQLTNGTYFANYFYKFGQGLKLVLDGPDANTWVGSIIIYIALIVYLIILFTLKNILTRDLRKINFIYWPWYHKSRVFNSICSSIDSSINNFLYRFSRNCFLFGIQAKDLPIIYEYLDIIESTPYSDDININHLKEFISKLDIKQKDIEKKKEKIKAKKKKQQPITKQFFDFNEDEQTKQNIKAKRLENEQNQQLKEETSNIKTQQQDVKMLAIASQWTDENGIKWALDQNGNYYYESNQQWVAY